MTVKVKATDDEQTSLTYNLYWNGSSSITQTKTANKNTEVTFSVSTAMYTNYSWRVVVQDGKGGEATAANSGKTKCSGSTMNCSGPNGKYCTNCGGYGILCRGKQVTKVTSWTASTSLAYEYTCYNCGNTFGPDSNYRNTYLSLTLFQGSRGDGPVLLCGVCKTSDVGIPMGDGSVLEPQVARPFLIWGWKHDPFCKTSYSLCQTCGLCTHGYDSPHAYCGHLNSDGGYFTEEHT